MKLSYMGAEITIGHAKKLRFLRKINDKKQIEVATAVQMSQQAYSKLENGETNFSDEVIEKISAFFKITPAEFEKPLDTFYIGSNNSNSGTNINTLDPKLFETLQNLYQENLELAKNLIAEKDKRIEELEARLKAK